MPKRPQFLPAFEAAREAQGKAAWRVIVPAAYSPTGRRQNLYFSTRAEAEMKGRQMRETARRLGSTGAALRPEDVALLAQIKELLNDSEVTAIEAISNYLELTKTFGPMAFLVSALRKTGARGRAVTVREAFGALSEAKDNVQSPHSVRSRHRRFGLLFRRVPGLESMLLGDINADDAEAILDAAAPHNPTSWNNLHRELSALYGFAIKKGWMAHNPLKMLNKRAHMEAEIRALLPEEISALFRASKKICPDHVPALAIMTFAGVRPAEMQRLTWGDVSFEDNVISVRARASKTGGTRHIRIRPVLRDWLLFSGAHSMPSDALIMHAAETTISKIRKAAGYGAENPWPQDALRHTFATYAVKAGDDLTALCWDMGHGSTTHIRQRYTNMRGITAAHCETFWQLTPDLVFN